MPKESPSIWSILQFLGKLWVIVTAVIGSLVVLGVLLIIIALKHAPSEKSLSPVAQKTIVQKGPDTVAVVNLSGVIMDSSGQSSFVNQSNTIDPKKVIRILDAIDADSSVKAVVLRLNTPGGAVVASDEIYQRVRQLRDHKPVVVSMADTTASGGYYISAAANEIVANPATITGSIGVIAELPQYSGLLDKIGVQMRIIKSGQFKDIGSPTRSMTPDEQAIFQTMIGEAYDQFVRSIADGRHMDESKVRALADGRIYTGLQAQKNGLIDQLGNEDTAISEAEKLAHISNASVVEYSGQSFWEALFQSEATALNFAPLSAVQAIIPQEKFGLYYLLSV